MFLKEVKYMGHMNPIVWRVFPIACALIAIMMILFMLIKVAKGNEALVVSGVGATDRNGNPTIKRAGGRIVIPFIQKAQYFDLCIRTAKVEGDVTKTISGVPVKIDWAVAYTPDTSSQESLQRAVCSFLDKDEKELERIILDVVSGGVRAVISKMTPEQVMNGKDELDDEVKKQISTQMKELGFNTILSIHEVEDADDSTYYRDLAARDRETKRRDAANIAAEAEQSMREKRAVTDQAAQEKELAAQVAVAERKRDTDVKKAEFKAETDRKTARAQQAAALEQEEINKELASRAGAVEIERQTQANLAALKEQEVAVTKAETNKRTTIINAEGEAERRKAEAVGFAEAQKMTAAGEAEASAIKKTREAEAAASAKKTEAAATAEALRMETGAQADATKMAGEAEAAAIAAKGLAEAEAIEARGKAEAEAARLLSDAQAANDKINFELQKIEIEQKTKVQIATNVATVMAEIGRNANFYDFGGTKTDGNLLTDVLGTMPQLFAKANLENEALNGEEVTDTIKKLVASIAEPIKGDSYKD